MVLTRDILLFWLTLALMLSTPAVAATYQVTGSGRQLTAALARARSGDTIVVHPGVYHVHLVVNKSVTLKGVGTPVLDGSGHGNVVLIKVPHVVLQGFVVRNSGRNLTNMDAGVFVTGHAAGVVIQDNRFVGDLFGIWLDGCNNPQVIGNVVRGLRQLRSPDRGDGIHFWSVKNGLASGNDIAYSRDGIYIYDSNHNTLSGNTMHDTRYGIHYMYSNHNRIIGNHTYHTRAGYALMESDHLLVQDNTSRDDRNYGILMNFITYSEIVHNRVIAVASGLSYATGGSAVAGAEGKALFAYNCVFNKITGNLFADSGIGLHLTAGSEQNQVYGNAFVHNHIQVRYGNNRPEEWSWKKQGNYWSDYMGWDLNSDGLGDVPYIPNDAMDRLLWIYPNVRLLINSPAIETVRWVQRQFPIFSDPKVRDSYPLMQSPVPLPKEQAHP